MKEPHLREALEWLVRLRDEKSGDDEKHAFRRWLGREPEHQTAWNNANALWESFEPAKQEVATLRKNDTAMSRRQVMLGLPSGAMLTGLGWHVTRPSFWADYKTKAGETQDITLADGSVINLGSRSTISVNFTPGMRRVDLLQGEAFFTVTPDQKRPFLVAAFETEITALGTAFNVNIWPDKASVAVAQHAVSITRAGHIPFTLNEGWQTSFDQSTVHAAVKIDQDNIGAWRHGRLIFHARPLRDVLSELSRYRGGRIVIWEDAIGDVPVTAVFDADHPDAALQTIAKTLNLKVLELPAGVAVLYT